MNRKSGFTLVELLAVISLIAIISLIGVVSYSNIKLKVLEKDYNALELKIVTVGKKYISDREVDKVYVKTLLKEGYLTSEDNKHVYNPVNNDILDCYYVSNLNAKLNEDNNC